MKRSNNDNQGAQMFRSFLLALSLIVASSPVATLAAPGTAPEKVSRASLVEEGHGVVVVSVRSSIFLYDPLDVFFVREGGDIEKDEDVFRFTRKQGFFAIGNDTTDYSVRTFQLPEGRYRLVAHGSTCPKVPEPGQTCSLRVEFAGSKERVSSPSKGYDGDTPVFEIRSGAVTYAGDFALDARNEIVWSEIPARELRKINKRFSKLARGPEPEVPLKWHRVGKLERRGALRDEGRTY